MKNRITKTQPSSVSKGIAKPMLAAGLSQKHKHLIVLVLNAQLIDYNTYIDSCKRFIKDPKNDVKFWSRQLKIMENKKKLATEIITEFTLK